MRFTRLRLNGFKSFVDPTDLVIATGLTGIVGPNGCGKSNLLEALRWVMGENRASAMRGDGMEDVIFAGASSRPARNFAEVALTLDNSERRAPSGFNDLDHLDIVRRITRDAGSAFKANGREVRARDVQMLFADASTGAHSPALVRQGQIAELINAKPANRRRVLEEAAGIAGLYQRRHEAELKLQATEANLLRVDDVTGQMAQQLAALARQVRQAVRYRDIGVALRRAEGVLLFRRWADAAGLRQQAEDALAVLAGAVARAEVAALGAARVRADIDAGMPALREEEAIAAAIRQRVLLAQGALAEQEAQAIAGVDDLGARKAELMRDIAREDGLSRDAGDTIARLTAEQVALQAAGQGHDDLMAGAVAAAQQAAQALSKAEATLADGSEALARLSARHQSLDRQIADARMTASRQLAEAAKAGEAAAAARAARGAALQDQAAAEVAAVAAQATVANADDALLATEAARAEAQAREADARALRSEAEGEAAALSAEAAALGRLVAQADHAGALVMDRLTVAAGYEAALGAALADDLRAPEVAEGSGTGWRHLPGSGPVTPLPDGATPLSAHVQVPSVLLRRIAQIGLVAAGDGDRLQAALCNGQRLVSAEGDLWRWDGYRTAAAEAPSATAQRLLQMNRLAAVRRDLDAVTARAKTARDAHAAATARVAELSAADHLAREARRDADRNLTEAMRRQTRAEAEAAIAAGRLDAAVHAMSRHDAEAATAGAALVAAQAALGALPDLLHARATADAQRLALAETRQAMLDSKTVADDLRRSGEARAARAQAIAGELAGWAGRAATAGAQRAELDARLAATEAELMVAVAVPAEIATRRAALSQAVEDAQARCRVAADALALAELALRDATTAEREAERSASALREDCARADARAEAARDAERTAVERIADETGGSPAALLDRLAQDAAAASGQADAATGAGIQPGDGARMDAPTPDEPVADAAAAAGAAMPVLAVPDGSAAGLVAASAGGPLPHVTTDALEAGVGRLRRQREALGAVNLRAEEDAAALQADHDMLVAERDDLAEAVARLRAGISGLNREGRERLLTAFEQVNANFTTLFTHLFGGGEARLVLVESDDPLEAGLEILCQPPGKKLSVLSLLSGGEQTLTALALIFGVFLANPAPICVLDEVDAPLDDANVARFCDLLDEMTRRTETRFLVITHHAVTMSRMDRLFGVTMGEPGVSQLVSVDLRRAEAMVA